MGIFLEVPPLTHIALNKDIRGSVAVGLIRRSLRPIAKVGEGLLIKNLVQREVNPLFPHPMLIVYCPMFVIDP